MFISLGLFFIIIIISNIFITIFNYFDLLNSNIISILKFIVPIISMFISSFKLGINSKQKGYLEGLKMGGIAATVMIILVLLFDKLSIKSIIYYVILILIAIFSSMLGINYKKI